MEVFRATDRATFLLRFRRQMRGRCEPKGVHDLKMLPNDRMDPLFLATVQATEEAVVNAMVAAETMTGSMIST